MSWFNKEVPGLEEQLPKSITIVEGGSVTANYSKPNEYLFGKRFFAEWSEAEEEENVEPWVIYDGSKGCKQVFCTDTEEHAKQIITFLDQAPPA